MALSSLEPDLPTLSAPTLIAAFDGWVDAGAASSTAVEWLAEGSRLVARFDGDALYDYRSRRPVLDVVDGVLRELTWHDLTLRHARHGDRDILVFAGAEPDLAWRALASEVADLARRLGVAQWISLGAVPAAIPHTRPVPVMATASQDGLLHGDEMRGPTGLLRVPAAALSVLELAVTESGTPAVGFFAQVPPYTASGWTPAAVALLDRVGRHLSVEFDLAELTQTANRERARYDAATAADAETREMVERLEAMAGAQEQHVPTGDELAREIERFLRDRVDEEPDGRG